MNDTITTWKCLLQPKKSRRLRFKLPSQLSVLVSHNSRELSYHILSHLSLKRNEEINIQITLTLRLTRLGGITLQNTQITLTNEQTNSQQTFQKLEHSNIDDFQDFPIGKSHEGASFAILSEFRRLIGLSGLSGCI